MRRVLLLALLAAAITRSAAQSPAPRPSGVTRWLDSSWRAAPLLSAVVPGSGQLSLGNARGVVYASLELLMWLKREKDRREQASEEGRFRALARDVARVHYATNPPEGEWHPYYEDVRDWIESGEYSQSNTGLVPPTDLRTFNGFLWAQIRPRWPDSLSALTEYEARAVKPEFRWSWRQAQLYWDIYRRSTERRNNLAQSVRNDEIILAANHLISFIDAFTMVRLRAGPTADGGIELRGSFAP
jgi:hypothetical protein